MLKNLIVMVISASFIFVTGRVFAQHEHGHDGAVTTDTASKAAVNAGNKICPVSVEKINEKTKATYEYEGKIYNFCCAMCIDSFKKDPGKYIKKVEEELKASAKDEKKTEPEAASHEHMHEGHHH